MALKHENEPNPEQIAAFLKDAVSKVESNPESFEELKRLFKKNVPFTRRSYVAAYLIKNASGVILRSDSRKNREEAKSAKESTRDAIREGSRHVRPETHEDQGAAREARETQESKSGKSQRDNRESRAEESQSQAKSSAPAPESKPRHEPIPRVEIPPEQAATIFVGIGRNRKVFPRDIVGLFISVAGAARERIGSIRVLTNYSFVEVFKDDADKIIAALNEYPYRGRKLQVSYSVKKTDEAFSSTEKAEKQTKSSEDSNDSSSQQNSSATEVAQENVTSATQETSPSENDSQVNATDASSSVEAELDNASELNEATEDSAKADSQTQQQDENAPSDEKAHDTEAAKSPEEMTDEEIAALRAPRSSSSEDM